MCVCVCVCVCVCMRACVRVCVSLMLLCVRTSVFFNAELDWRRLCYLGNSMQEQFELETKLVLTYENHDITFDVGLSFHYFDQY